MGATTAVEGIAGAGVALPQGIIGLAVNALDLLPLFQDGANAVAGGLPLGGVFGNLFCLSCQLFLGSNSFLAAAFLIGLRLLAGFYRVLNDGNKAAVKCCDITDDRSGRQGVAQLRCGLFDASGLAGVGAQARLEQFNFGGEVVVARAVVL